MIGFPVILICMTTLHSLLTDKPAIAPPVFVFQKDKAQKVRLPVLLWPETIQHDVALCH